MHQTNGGLDYVGLNADCSRKVLLAYSIASIKINN